MSQSSLCLIRGDDIDIGATVLQPDGSVYSLTGCSLTFSVRENANYFSQLLFVRTGTLISPADGTAKFTLVPDDTDNLGDNPYFFEIKLIDANAKIKTLNYGTLTLAPR